MAAQSMPVVETAFYGWKIWVQGEHVRVTRPDGSVSEWHERPATNGSGLYDLCLVVARETPGAAAWIGTPKEGGKPGITLEPDTRDDWEARYGRTIEPLYRHAPRRTGWWYSDVWQPLTLDDAIDQMSDMREDWAEMGCRLGFDSYTDVEPLLARASELVSQVGEAMDREQLGDLVEGMAVSVDVDGLFSTDGRRLFGTITAVQHEDGEKGGLMLLVQEPEPNWKPEQVGEVQGDALREAAMAVVGHIITDTQPAYDAKRQLIAALAARQPVHVQGSDELSARTDGERAAYLEGIKEGNAQAARQPGAQEPVCFIPPKDAELLRRREFSLRSMCSAWEPPSYENNWVGVYLAAPPAQGIDLGQLQLYRLASGPLRTRGLHKDDTGSWVKIQDVERLIGQRDAAPGVKS